MTPESSATDLSERQLIAQVARRFYLEDESKVEIGRSIGISRFKVARLLAAGREQGIIRIEILEPTTDLPTFSAPLREHLGLEQVRVIDSTGPVSQVRTQLGAMGAQYLSDCVQPGEILGFGWGRTTLAVAKNLPTLPMVTAVQLTGAIRDAVPQSPIEAIREMIEAHGGSAHPIVDPLYVGSTTELQRYLRGLTYIVGLYDHLTTAVLSIGSWDPPTTQLRELFPPMVRERLDSIRPAAELGGIWLASDGHVVCPEVTRGCITIASHQLLKTPHVVAVAGGEAKAEAIMAVARSGLITSLITDRAAAENLLSLPPVGQAQLTRARPKRG